MFIFTKKISDKDLEFVGTDSTRISNAVVSLIFALHCQFSFLSIYNILEVKKLPSVATVCDGGSILTVTLYGLSGLLGYRAKGKNTTNEDMLSEFLDEKGTFMTKLGQVKQKSTFEYEVAPRIALISFMFIFFGAIIFSAFPTIPVIEGYIQIRGKQIKKYIIAIFFAVFLLITNLLVKENSADLLLDIIGAACTNPLSFVFHSIFMSLLECLCILCFRSF